MSNDGVLDLFPPGQPTQESMQKLHVERAVRMRVKTQHQQMHSDTHGDIAQIHTRTNTSASMHIHMQMHIRKCLQTFPHLLTVAYIYTGLYRYTHAHVNMQMH